MAALRRSLHWLLSATLILCPAAPVLWALARAGYAQPYALDDPYIHLSVARTLAAHGVWGLDANHPAMATSSPGWTLVLAGFYRLGLGGRWLPLALNLALLPAVCVLLWRSLRVAGLSARAATLATAALGLVVPLPALVFVGMEHMLHTAFALLLTQALLAELAAPEGTTSVQRSLLPLWALCATSMRYETLFLLAAGALLLLRARRFRSALLVALGGAAPVLVTGLSSRASGGYFLPNALLAKTRGQLGAWLDWKSWVLNLNTLGDVNNLAVQRFYVDPPAVVLLVLAPAVLAALLLFAGRGASGRKLARGHVAGLVLGLLTLVQQLAFARQGAFFRYEAWVFAVLGAQLVAGGAYLWRATRRRARPLLRPSVVAALVALVAALGWPLLARGFTSAWLTPRMLVAIGAQQFEMAAFLSHSFPGVVVALNDIGAVSYEGRVEVVDLEGLADTQALRARYEGRFNAAWIDAHARYRGASLALVYDSWFEATGLPASWVLVGRWTTPNGDLLGSRTVSFYALDPAYREPLYRALLAWRAHQTRLTQVVLAPPPAP